MNNIASTAEDGFERFLRNIGVAREEAFADAIKFAAKRSADTKLVHAVDTFDDRGVVRTS